jgi:demethylmenaquinone methyltransferase/2-methoxy-6-polyprenyl-1,4-benzoquinol methylase
VVKPGGTVAVLFWTNQVFLPGYPQLEARLNLAFTANTHYFKIGEPARHHMRTLGWLRSAGLLDPKAQSFVSGACAPLSDELRASIGFCFSMLWGGLKPHLEESDWFEYVRICTPDSPHFILNSPDYCCTLTYTLFHAKVSAN